MHAHDCTHNCALYQHACHLNWIYVYKQLLNDSLIIMSLYECLCKCLVIRMIIKLRGKFYDHTIHLISKLILSKGKLTLFSDFNIIVTICTIDDSFSFCHKFNMWVFFSTPLLVGAQEMAHRSLIRKFEHRSFRYLHFSPRPSSIG